MSGLHARPLDDELALLRANLVEEIPKGGLREKLALSRTERRPLRIKFGVDPTSPDIHLGHTVPLRTLRRFQDCGHTVIFLIGDFTAMIGDPSGRSTARPQLTKEQVDANAETFLSQVGRIMDRTKLEIRRNAEWSAPMTFADVIRLASKYTVARILERDDFAKRYKAGTPIAVHEFLYPLVQGYDSVALKADIELCSTDQIFNCLVARTLQEDAGQGPEAIIATPLIEGTDGVKKMSKSVPAHAIGVTESPDQMYGKLLSIPDTLTEKYAALLLDDPLPAGLSPRDAKHALAKAVVTRYHDAAAATDAADRFERTVVKKEAPDRIPEVAVPAALVKDGKVWLAKMLREAGLVPSQSEAQRLIEQGAVSLDGRVVTDARASVAIADGAVLKYGKRSFARLRVSNS